MILRWFEFDSLVNGLDLSLFIHKHDLLKMTQSQFRVLTGLIGPIITLSWNIWKTLFSTKNNSVIRWGANRSGWFQLVYLRGQMDYTLNLTNQKAWHVGLWVGLTDQTWSIDMLGSSTYYVACPISKSFSLMAFNNGIPSRCNMFYLYILIC